ncbi:MAG: ATP-dependent sacrificial sulfur transferase LarE [Candidatus Sumerlaeota bacterium]
MTPENRSFDNLIGKICDAVRACGDSVIVALSGGVDSTVMAALATKTLGRERVLCVCAKSESNTGDDVELCRAIARDHGLQLEVIEYSELAIPQYASNPANRCYFCKSELYTRLSRIAHERGFCAVLDGSNADDGGDYRPGLKAVREEGVRSPLRECGATKDDVRAIAELYGLPNFDKPSSPCLSSRIPYGSEITGEKLQQVAAAEKFLRGIGLRNFRCRHHGDIARLEVAPDEFSTLLSHRDAVVAELRRAGFKWVSMDLAGFVSGSLNAVLTPEIRGLHTDSEPRQA